MNLRSCVALILVAACTAQGQITQVIEPQDSDIRTETFTAALDEVTTAKVIIDVPFQEVFIRPLEESDNLIEAEVEYIGAMTFTADKGAVTIRETIGGESYTGDKPLRWNIRVNPAVELVLEIEVDSGDVTLDASGLNVTALTLNTDSGTIEANLPVTPVDIDVEVTSGEINVNAPDGADADVIRIGVGSGEVRLNIGADADVIIDAVEIESGEVVVDVAQEMAVRLEVQQVASGMVNIAYQMARLDGTGSDEGMWETEGYAAADHHVSIVVTNIGSGTFELE